MKLGHPRNYHKGWVGIPISRSKSLHRDCKTPRNLREPSFEALLASLLLGAAGRFYVLLLASFMKFLEHYFNDRICASVFNYSGGRSGLGRGRHGAQAVWPKTGGTMLNSIKSRPAWFQWFVSSKQLTSVIFLICIFPCAHCFVYSSGFSCIFIC